MVRTHSSINAGFVDSVSIAAFWLVTAATTTASPQQPSNEVHRLKSEGPKAWADYQERCLKYCGTIVTEVRDNEKISAQNVVTFRHNKNCVKFEFQHNFVLTSNGQNRPRGQLIALNPQYAFELLRGDASSKWAIANTHFDSSTQPAFFLTQPPDLVRVYTSGLALQLFFPTAGINDMLQDPDFKILSVMRESDPSLVRVEFTTVSKWLKDRMEWMPITSGHVVLRPDQSWLPELIDIKYEFADSTRGWWKGRHEYLDRNGIPILKKTQYEGISTIVKTGQTTPMSLKADCTYEIASDLPDSEFSLTHFGFAEPINKPRSWTRFGFWLLGLFSLIVAMVVQRTMRTSRGNHG